MVTTAQLVLALAAFIAGAVDAVAGGGGLITFPSLVSAGLPPHLALGTNKGQSVFGSFAALTAFTRAGKVDRQRAPFAFVMGFTGSLLGAELVLHVSPKVLRPVVLTLLVAVAAFLAFRPPTEEREAMVSPSRRRLAAALCALVLGAYDGFFGPGVGTFLIVSSVLLLGEELTRATANAKVVNFASNLAAVVVFTRRGVIDWGVALPMAGAQFAGALLGARVAVKGGARVIRYVVLAVVCALVAKLSLDLWRAR